MNKKQTTAWIAALALSITSLGVSAQPHHGGPRDSGPAPYRVQAGPQHKQAAPVAHPHRPMAHPPVHAKPAPHHAQRPGHAPHGSYVQRHGAGPKNQWVQGSRVPAQYRTKHYVVHDWRHHGLQQPPRGQQWVQYGSDYLLAAVATGVISQLILGR